MENWNSIFKEVDHATPHDIENLLALDGRVLDASETDQAFLALADFIDIKAPHTLGHSRALADLADRKPFLDAMMAAVPFARDSDIAVLDVGGGSGAIAAAVLGAFPRARVTLQDFSEPMIESARKTFAARAGQMHYVRHDLLDPAWEQAVGGPFDLVVSAIAIHNLRELSLMAACYQAIYRLLRAGG